MNFTADHEYNPPNTHSDRLRQRHLDLAERDLRYIWHPCSQMKDYESFPPLIIERGEGCWLYDVEGKRYLDIISSWWANLLGHCNSDIKEAIKEQLDKLEHVIFANFSHEGAIRVAEELSEILPKEIKKFHFNDNGSAAVECALKMCFQYYLQVGKSKKTRFMCLSEGYHGETIGALSVGSMDLYTKMYQPIMIDTEHIEAPDCYRCPYAKSRDDCDCECFAHAEDAFEKYAATTAAIIVEPLLQGSAGMRMYPPLYLKKLRALCDKCDVKLIVDEIATGFGRTGKMFAIDYAGIAPDVICLSKGLTGGYMPMSLTCVTDEIYDAFYADYSSRKAFMHSHTYSGNPLGCAAALAVQKLLKRDNILDKAAIRAKYLTQRLSDALLSHKNVGEIRHLGLIHAIELVKDKAEKSSLPSENRTGYQIYKKALAKGLLLRPLGDVLYFNPPLTITESELDFAVDIAQRAILEELPA